MAPLGVEAALNLSGKTWKPIPRISVVVPFGYRIDADDKDVLMPVIHELEALEKAKEYIKNRFSLRSVAKWLTIETGRSITANGLKVRCTSDAKRSRKVNSLKKWAREIESAYKKAKAIEERYGGDVEATEEARREFRDYHTSFGKGVGRDEETRTEGDLQG